MPVTTAGLLLTLKDVALASIAGAGLGLGAHALFGEVAAIVTSGIVLITVAFSFSRAAEKRSGPKPPP